MKNDVKWCYTEVDSKGVGIEGKWGNCGPGCLSKDGKRPCYNVSFSYDFNHKISSAILENHLKLFLVCYCENKVDTTRPIPKAENGIICTSDGKDFQENGFCDETQACMGPTKDDPFLKGFPSSQKHLLCTSITWKGIYL